MYLHSCSVLGCRRYISGLWRDVCIEFVCVFKGHGHWEEYLLGRSVFFSRGPLSLCILESMYLMGRWGLCLYRELENCISVYYTYVI